MFEEEKPSHPMQIGAIDLHCDVKDVLEGFYLHFELNMILLLSFFFHFI